VLDQALLLEFGEGSERRGDRLLAGAVVGGGAEVDHVEYVEAQAL
jgi:hypothetical protein